MHFLKFFSRYQYLFLLFYVINITLIQFSYLNSDIFHDDPQSWLQKKLCLTKNLILALDGDTWSGCKVNLVAVLHSMLNLFFSPENFMLQLLLYLRDYEGSKMLLK